MKTCPVCNAVAFDDQAICFGCLHSFEKNEQSAEIVETSANLHDAHDAVSFLLSFVPHPQDTGSIKWTCTVEPVAATQ